MSSTEQEKGDEKTAYAPRKISYQTSLFLDRARTVRDGIVKDDRHRKNRALLQRECAC
jgi:hypothetical protein